MNQVLIGRMKFLMKILLAVMEVSNAASSLHVSEEEGSTEVSCGSITNPCKYLHKAVEKCSEGGEVIVHGVLTLTSGIMITKDISIVGRKAATIKGSKPSLVAFNVTSSSNGFRNVSISNMIFIDISVVSIESSASIRISNCSIHHNFVPNEELGQETMTYNQTLSGEEIEGAVLQVGHQACGTILEVRNSKFAGWQQGYVLMMKYFSSSIETKISFDECLFVNTQGVYLSKIGMVSLEVHNSAFNNMMCRAIFMEQIDKRKPCSLFVANSSFSNNKGCTEGSHLNNGGAISTTEVSSIALLDCFFENCTTGISSTPNKGGVGGALFAQKKRTKSTLLIQRSVFVQNIASRHGGDVYARANSFILRDCHMARSRGDIGGGGSVRLVLTGTFYKGVVSNCTFVGNMAKVAGGAVAVKAAGMNGKITFENSKFFDNKAVKTGGAVSVQRGFISGKSKMVNIKSCTFSNNSGYLGGGLFIEMMQDIICQKYDDCRPVITIRNSVFVSNSAMIGGAVEIVRQYPNCNRIETIKMLCYNSLIDSCEFMNNSATSLGQSIYSNDHLKISNISVVIFEKRIAPHLSLETGALSLQNVRIQLSRDTNHPLPAKSRGIELKSNGMKLTKGLMITCPTNFRLEKIKMITEEISGQNPYRLRANGCVVETMYSYLSVDCQACPYGQYSLQNGELYIPVLSTVIPTVNNFTLHDVECTPCPTGAICDGDVKAVDNYWGFKDETGLSFILCPHGYCCGSETTPCTSFNTCAPGRSGKVCGTCAEGYKQSFVAGECIKKEEGCIMEFFIAYFVMYSFAYTLIFVLITNGKDIIAFLKRKLSTKDQLIDSSLSDSGDKLSLAGFFQITILFFQLAGLLQVKFQGGHQTSAPYSDDEIRQAIGSFFNFRFVIYQKLCPSDDLNLPQKEMIIFGIKIATVIHLVLFVLLYFICKSLYTCYKSWKPQSSTADPVLDLMPTLAEEGGPCSSIDDKRESFTTISFLNMLKFTFIKLLKIYYTPVTKFSLTLIHCLTIGNQSHLYVYGDHVCYSGWQYVIMFGLLPALLIFPISFELMLRLLKRRKISSWQFVIAAAGPCYAVHLYIKRRSWHNEEDPVTSPEYINGNEEESFRQMILQGEEELYKEVKEASLGWQIVQLYRSFAVTILSTYMVNPMYRQMTYNALILVFIVHDRYRNPYKHPYLNILQSRSSRCLLLVLVCNIIPAMSYLVNVRTIPLVYEVVKISGIAELIVYFAVPFSLVVWKVKTLIDNQRNSGDKNK